MIACAPKDKVATVGPRVLSPSSWYWCCQYEARSDFGCGLTPIEVSSKYPIDNSSLNGWKGSSLLETTCCPAQVSLFKALIMTGGASSKPFERTETPNLYGAPYIY